jgi:hypothetical protein
VAQLRRFGGAAGWAILVGLVLGLAPRLGQSEPPLLSELKWIHSDADAVAALTTQPPECFAEPATRALGRRARLGRVAFRSPFLLGGVASRVGMSCDTCHRNGHDNPDFFVEGVSGGPGTADVTGAVFSRRRDDGEQNPVRIPSLLDASITPPFGTVLPAADLRSFIHTAVVDEFEGEPPLEPVVEGLVLYLQALQASACPERSREARTFEASASDLLQTFDVLIESRRQSEDRVTHFVVLSLRAELERMYRRFPPDVFVRERLIEHSRALSKFEGRLVRPIAEPAATDPGVERAALEETLRVLGREVSRSYYEPNVLKKALESTP